MSLLRSIFLPRTGEWLRREARGLRREENNTRKCFLGNLGLLSTIISWFINVDQSKEECEYLIDLAKPRMVKSSVVDSKTGKSKDSRVRTSSGTFLRRGKDKIIRDIEKRIADYTFIPVENGEGLQVLHYEEGQKYEPHYDYFVDEFNTKNGGQRMATMLMYLSDVEEGGETVFPAANMNYTSVPWYNELSECGKKGLSVKPKMGDALLFWSMRPDASLDPSSLHGGCPVIKGNKWSSTKWMRAGEYKV
ncbi:PREDICTED: probable prolyl 4-hydroxylase 3 isoform X2 [Tarenaya hassleriana]|uniref:probable prolyl 4-hydroxylase 3 isoform X2 n=1 Tax=Tarenaya hassleriana TaxID=28532 RepID=UPI00053C97CF|nr:PREDICTED: probable prolyl 4-hydroxylase 3 isoform X2 [Tarenaya hassleriana]